MYFSVESDINPLLQHIVNALQPIAQGKDVELSFSPGTCGNIVHHEPEIVANSLFSLLCRILHYLPSKAVLQVSIHNYKDEVRIIVENSGINLSRVNEIIKNILLPIDIKGERNNKTIYSFTIKKNKHLNDNNGQQILQSATKPSVPGYYAEIKKRLQAHYNTADKLVILTKIYNPSDASFLQKVNDIIFFNIGDESFDANKLSSEICLSRTQLFRKLKNIVGQSPADYIRRLRLQKAKRLLETTGKRIGEVACETGFESMSHFTKVFSKRYGFKPSELKRKAHGTK